MAKYDAVLAKLPKDADGNWTVASCLDSLFNTLVSSNACASQLIKPNRPDPTGSCRENESSKKRHKFRLTATNPL